jgi:hypothetical protein
MAKFNMQRLQLMQNALLEQWHFLERITMIFTLDFPWYFRLKVLVLGILDLRIATSVKIATTTCM